MGATIIIITQKTITRLASCPYFFATREVSHPDDLITGLVQLAPDWQHGHGLRSKMQKKKIISYVTYSVPMNYQAISQYTWSKALVLFIFKNTKFYFTHSLLTI